MTVPDLEGGICAVRAWPQTGRTHQIRVHLDSVGLPLVGDKVYGHDESFGDPIECHGMERQALHAEKIEFEHEGGLITAEAPLPADMGKLCRY